MNMDLETQLGDVIAVPFPFQGHLNPMLQFCSSLSARGVRVTLVLTHRVAKSMAQSQHIHTVELISDGTDVGDSPRNYEEMTRMPAAVSEGVAAIIQKQKKAAKVLVHDAMMPWLLEVGRAGGLRVAPLFTQPASLCAVYYHMLRGNVVVLQQPITAASDSMLRLPSLPEMELRDVASIFQFPDNPKQIAELIFSQASNLPKADCFLINTFHSLEEQVVKWLTDRWSVKTVGPLVPILHKDRIDLFKLDGESYVQWLDIREPKSVVYVSFGSVAVFTEEQMEEIAWGLAQSNKYFIWVVRELEQVKLPPDFKSKISGKGVIVNWCPQVEVLSHKAIACFMTHCGWNSILEALCLGVPMVAMPYFVDQPMNAKLVEDVWKVGVRVKVNEKGIVTRQEVEGCIKQVTEGEKVQEFRRNVTKWKGLAKEATSECGSSYMNINDFISQMAC